MRAPTHAGRLSGLVQAVSRQLHAPSPVAAAAEAAVACSAHGQAGAVWHTLLDACASGNRARAAVAVDMAGKGAWQQWAKANAVPGP